MPRFYGDAMNGVRTLPYSAAPIPVAVVAGDPITRQGTIAYLRTRSEVNVLNAERHHEADVVLIIVDTITGQTLRIMKSFASATESRRRADPRFVIIGDGLREQHVAQAVSHGLVSVISRHETDFGHVVRTIVDVQEGRMELPGDAVGWLAEQLRRIHKDVLEPQGLNTAGLSTREVEVLRMLADGMGTSEIAQKLNYSERTIKNTIYAMLTRLGLRNRVHAVAYAIRNNAL
jgi:DNA-binding NarL/FixJ family response regulator